MGCGCGSGSIHVVSSKSKNSLNITPNVDCPYNDVILLDFKNKLTWFKNNGLYLEYNITASVMNKYIGTVISSININDKCTYESILNEVSNLVDLIITLQ